MRITYYVLPFLRITFSSTVVRPIVWCIFKIDQYDFLQVSIFNETGTNRQGSERAFDRHHFFVVLRGMVRKLWVINVKTRIQKKNRKFCVLQIFLRIVKSNTCPR